MTPIESDLPAKKKVSATQWIVIAMVTGILLVGVIEMAKEVDTLVVITPGGPTTAKLINAEVLDALGPRGVGE